MAVMASDHPDFHMENGPLGSRLAFGVGSGLRRIYRAISCGAQLWCHGDPLDTDLKEVRQA
jgi:hypothetical protein